MAWIRCGRCDHPFDTHFVLGSTMLGPEIVRCRLCRSPLESGRREWHSFSAFQKLKFGFRSLLYATLCAFAFGYIPFTSYYALWDMPRHDTLAFLHHTPFFVLSLVAASTVLVLQLWRVRRSYRRDHVPAPHPMARWLLDGDFALQFKALLLLVLFWIAATGLGRWLRSDSTRGPRVRDSVALRYCPSSDSSEKRS